MNAQFQTPQGRALAARAMGPEAAAAERLARTLAAIEAAAILSRISGQELAPLEESEQ